MNNRADYEDRNDERILAQRLVASSKWRKMAGMLGLDGWRILAIHGGEISWERLTHEPWMPDMRDRSTQECVIELVREALDIQLTDVFALLRPAVDRGIPFAVALVDLFELTCDNGGV